MERNGGGVDSNVDLYIHVSTKVTYIIVQTILMSLYPLTN